MLMCRRRAGNGELWERVSEIKETLKFLCFI